MEDDDSNVRLFRPALGGCRWTTDRCVRHPRPVPPSREIYSLVPRTGPGGPRSRLGSYMGGQVDKQIGSLDVWWGRPRVLLSGSWVRRQQAVTATC